MKFVLNGCSFCDNYYLAEQLARILGYDEFVKLAKGGSSNRRIIRTTIEHIEQYGADFVLMGLTFWERQEGAFKKTQKNSDNWISYNAEGMQGLFAPPGTKFIEDVPSSIIQKYIQESYKCDINLIYFDQLMCDLVMFSSYLKQKNIRHIIFNTCETEYSNYFTNFNNIYQKSIEENKNIVPLDKFVSNLYLHELGAKFDERERRWDVNAIHYSGDEYRHINDYLLNYIQQNNL